MQKLHVKILLLLLTVAGGVVVGVGLYSKHRSEAESQRQEYNKILQRADREREDGRFAEAVVLYKEYLSFVPGNVDVRASLGMSLEELADSPKEKQEAFRVLEKVLRLEPERSDLRRRVVGLMMDLGQHLDALSHLVLLRMENPKDVELLELSGECYEATKQYSRAARAFESAIELEPDRFTCYRRLANLLHTRLNQTERATFLLDEMVAASPESFQAFLIRGRFRKQNGMALGAGEDLTHCLQLAPDNADVLLANIEYESELQKFRNPRSAANSSAIRNLINRALELYPSDARFHEKLAFLELQGGNIEQAITTLQKSVQILPEEVNLIWILAELLVKSGRPKESSEVFSRLKEMEITKEQDDYIDARLLWHQGKRHEAVRLLGRTAPKLARWDAWWKQVNLVLGDYHGQLGQPDQQLADYKRVFEIDPKSMEGNLGLALALLALERIEETLEQCRRSRELTGFPSPEWILFSEQLIRRNQRLPRSIRDWELVAQLLRASRTRLPDSTREFLRRAATLLGENRVEESLQVIALACEQNPQQVELWTTRALLTELREAGGWRLEAGGSSENVMKVFEEARQQLGNRVELQLAQVGYWVRQGSPESKVALTKLAENHSAEQDVHLSYGLAKAFVRLGEFAEAERLWNRLAKNYPEDLRCRQHLFELAHLRGDAQEMERLLGQIRAIEGPEGTFWRCSQAAYDIEGWRLEAGGWRESRSLQSIRKTLNELNAERPFWRLPPLYLAKLEEIQGRTREAADEYLRAITLGTCQPAVILRTARLLASGQRFEEADDLIWRLEKDFPITGESARLAAEVAIRTGDPQRALGFAQRAELGDSQDYRDWQWLARFFRAAGQSEGEEKALRRAVTLGPEAPEPWITLVRFLVRSDRNKAANAEIEKARGAIPAVKASLALARCQEILGNLEEAEKLYEVAQAERPDDLEVLKSVARFHFSFGNASKSLPIFGRILEDPKLGASDEVRAAARRSLAMGLAAGADYQQFQKSLRILDEGGDTPEDRIVRAHMLAIPKIGRHRREAILILEELDHNKKLSADDRFLLAKLHDAAADWSKARAIFRSLLRSTDPKGDYLAYYVRSLLLRGKIVEARTWCDQLAKREPQNPRTIRLQASLLASQGKFDETIRLSNGLVMRKESQLDQQRVLLTNAMFLYDLGRALDRSINQEVSAKLFAEAEKLYRDQLSARPEVFSRLAPLLAHLGRSDEALDLCEKAWSSCSPDLVAKTCITILQSSNENTDERFRRVENQLKEAIDEHSEASVALQIRMAQLCLLQRRFEEATELYRRILAEDPQNIAASNNLACLLAQDPQHAPAALELIERVIGKVGPTANFLDTRGLVHIALGDCQSAIKDLEEALTGDHSPIIRFHLAWAYRLAGRGDEALTAFRESLERGLIPEMLFPGERKFYLEWTERMTK